MKTNFDRSANIVERWSDLGFQRETISLLPIIPAVQIAWAEGFLQAAERRVLLQIFNEMNLPEEKTFGILLGWLDERPTDDFFVSATDILSDWLAELNTENRANVLNFLHVECLRVAQASAKIGLTKDTQTICREEQRQLEQIAHRLGLSFA